MKVLMTGNARSFGKYLSDKLKARGHTVIGVDIDPSADIQLDLAKDYDKLPALMDEVEYDVLINNAGMMHLNWLPDFKLEDWQKEVALNMTVPFITMQHAMNSGKCHRVVNTCSMVTQGASGACIAYNASKSGLETITKAVAKEAVALKKDLQVYGIAPCSISDSAMIASGVKGLMRTRGLDEASAKKYLSQSTVSMEELAKLYVWVVESAPAASTGSIYYVPGVPA